MITFTTRLTEEAQENVWTAWLAWLDIDAESAVALCIGDYTFDIAFWEERDTNNKNELIDFVEGELNNGLNSQVFEGWGLGKDSTGKTWLSEVFDLYDKELAEQDKVRYALWDKQVEFYKQLVALADDAGYVVKRQPAGSVTIGEQTDDCETLNERLVDHDWEEGEELKVPFDFFIGAKEVE
jgi:hypothetical protein